MNSAGGMAEVVGLVETEPWEVSLSFCFCIVILIFVIDMYSRDGNQLQTKGRQRYVQNCTY